MTTPEPSDLLLLGHSHGVALLDGISSWRERGKVSASGGDTRFGAAFQGWFNGAVSADPFEAEVIDDQLPFTRMQAWLISSGSGIGELARLERRQGADTLLIHQKLSATLGAWNGPMPIVSMLNGNEHAQVLLNRLPPYDFIDADSPGVQPGVPVIDGAFIDQAIAGWVNAVWPALLAVRRMATNPLIHELPPPPREHPERSSHFEVMDKLESAFGFLPGPMRLKWYRRYCRHLNAQLSGLGVQVLAAPAEACTPEGLLKAEFAEGLTHGNAAYGRLVAKQLCALLEAALNAPGRSQALIPQRAARRVAQ